MLWYREREHDEGSLSAGYPAADVLLHYDQHIDNDHQFNDHDDHDHNHNPAAELFYVHIPMGPKWTKYVQWLGENAGPVPRCL